MMDLALAIGTSNTQSNDEDDGGSDTIIDSPPRPVRTSSPRQSLSSLMSSSPSPSRPSPPHHTRPRRLSASDNFRKYGSIRPPLSVLQKEFCTTYRLWEEHDAILRRVELKPTANNAVMMRAGNQSDRNDWRRFKPRQGQADEVEIDEVTEWEEAFAHLRALYSRHHNDYDSYQEQQLSSLGDYQGSPKNEFLESLCAIDDDDNNNNLEEKLEEEVERNTNDDAKLRSCDEREIDNSNEHQQTDSEQQRKRRADVETLTKLFCPGTKLSGTIAFLKHPTDAVTIHSEFSLIIMEENTCDEMGKPKGYLARQKKGSDEQCVFIHVKFIPLKDATANLDDVELFNDDITASSVGSRAIPQSQSPLEPDEKITMQIEYTDSEKRYWGFWNPDKLCFEGTAHKLGEVNDTTNRGGLGNNTNTNNAIMGGLISGRAALSGTGSDGGDTDVDNNDAAMTATSTLSPKTPRKLSTFSLSPCTNLHPHGRTQASMWNRFAMSHLASMVGGNYFNVSGSVGLFGSAFNPNNAFSVNEENNKVSEQEQLSFMDELASDDNHKFALHRARTEMLLLETLMKLTELGAILDFAELARKRNVAIRREKWRSRMRKITPKLPRKLKRRKKKKAAGSDDFDFSIDSVQKKKVQFYDHLAVISWDRLLEAASIQAQRTCASFRHRSSLLDSLTFQSDEYKYQVMCDLRANGLTLASSHSEWDRCIQMGRTVSLGWSWFERGSWGCFERSAVVGKRCVYILFQMHSKLSVCHEQLEKSFRGADARISVARLESLKQVRCIDKSEQDESDEIVCGICQCDIRETDGDEEENCEETCIVVNLPCSHSFHYNCIREWLHYHSKCPICRIDLNE